MKMSEVFDKDAISNNGEGKPCYWMSMNDLEAEAAAHAIMLHDELVEMIENIEDFVIDVRGEDTRLYNRVKRLSHSIELLLEKARGE